jgi:hypothetical protein
VRAAAAAGLAVIAVVHDPYPLAPDAAALVTSLQHSLAGVKGEILGILDRIIPGDQRL